jgi:hypothetical protein
MKKSTKDKSDLTGVAFTIQASKEKGFNNFKICTLFIEDGEIIHTEKSQEFAAFEAIARTEIFINAALWNLSSRYKDGDYQSLGGDQRKEIINKLSETNPELLKKISKALYLEAKK